MLDVEQDDQQLRRRTRPNIALRSSDDIPSAQGRLAVKGSEGPNQVVDLTVKHMAPPAKVKAGATAYVVWLEPDAAKEPINMGVLSVDKDLNGQLQFKTPFPKFEVFVTAEAEPDGAGAVRAHEAADGGGRSSGSRDPVMADSQARRRGSVTPHAVATAFVRFRRMRRSGSDPDQSRTAQVVAGREIAVALICGGLIGGPR